MFTQAEIDYIRSQRLARLATVNANGQPDAVVVGFDFDDSAFYIGGRNQTNSRKYKNVKAGREKVALVIDDLASVNPWRPRGIRIYGEAQLVTHDGYAGKGEYLRIVPDVSWSWGFEGASKRTVHAG
jgi:pyridoxamine 5'-phosphate oxidase family protein